MDKENYVHSLTFLIGSWLLLIVGTGAEVRAQHLAVSTHDWANLGTAAPDQWADVATPGNGMTYAVGTTTVTNSNEIVFGGDGFSGANVVPPLTVPAFTAVARVVVILQASDSSGIAWQRYFYGTTAFASAFGYSSFARRVSVAVAPSELDTRIVICGDTFDQTLPMAITPPYDAAALAGAFDPSGFIAVFNGAGSLLWSRQFYGEDFGARTGVTDVSVRWDAANGNDIITYCGVSTNGRYDASITPPPPTTMAPVLPFVAPVAPLGCASDIYAGGAAHNAAPQLGVPITAISTDQWDGFVGRLIEPHSGAVGNNPVFHSIVGGGHNDVLISLTEIDDYRFAVVGVTDLRNAQSNNLLYPLTRASFKATLPAPCLSGVTATAFGVLTVFDSELAVTQALPLEIVNSVLIGNAGETACRDVLYHGGILYVGGSTNDTTFLSGFSNLPWAGNIPGVFQGFVVTSFDNGGSFRHASFFDRGYQSGVTGLAAWPDHGEHVSVVGWTRDNVVAPTHIRVLSLFFDTPSSSSPELIALRDYVISANGLGTEAPAADEMSLISALSLSYSRVDGSPQGGGIAVDEKGRATVVGHNRGSNDFPVIGGLPPQAPGHGASSSTDAVRAVVDMLPLGVCRTDGTGACTPVFNIASGFSGGTTPSCALTTVGGTLGHVLLDFQGQLQPGPVSILVDRPPVGGAIYGGAIQLGFPNPVPILALGIESWIDPIQGVTFAILPSGKSYRQSLVLPPGPVQFTIQYITLMATTFGPPCTGALDWAASPALIVGY